MGKIIFSVLKLKESFMIGFIVHFVSIFCCLLVNVINVFLLNTIIVHVFFMLFFTLLLHVIRPFFYEKISCLNQD